MRFSLVDGVCVEPQPSLAGECRVCGRDMISKCGEYVRWHWAHKRRTDCDAWHEAETDWHLMWKDAFPTDCQEIVQIDEKTGEKHVADVRTPGGVVVEVQHSRISDDELRSREDFYDDMIWIVDARDVVWTTSRELVSLAPMSYDFQVLSRSTLLTRWCSARRPVYLDNTAPVYRDSERGTLWVLPPERRIPISERAVWRVLQYDVENNTGLIAPVPADWIVEATMHGERVPLPKCNETDAWQYRMGLVEVGGRLDDGDRESRVAPTVDIEQENPARIPIDDDDLPF